MTQTPTTTTTKILAALAVATQLAVTAGVAHAGARESEIVFVWMGPDTKPAQACRKAVLRELRKSPIGGENHITTSKPAAVAKRLGVAPEAFAKTWFRVPTADFEKALRKPMRAGTDDVEEDSVIVAACDPDRKLAYGVVRAASLKVYRVRFSGLAVDDKLAEILARTLFNHGQEGFSP